MPVDDGGKIRRPDLKGFAGALELKNLQGLLEERNTLLKKISDEKATLEAENLNLKKEVQQRAIEIQNFSREKTQIEEKFKKISELDKKTIADNNSEIIRLKSQLEEISRSKNPDEQVLKELINTKFQLQEVNLQSNRSMQELIEIKSNLAIRDEKLRKATDELENLNRVIADNQFERISIKNELEMIKNKVQRSFTPEEISDSLNATIESFNNQVNTVDSAVNYVINGMDIELKTQVYKDDLNRVMFSSADLASKSENSLSSIKFSIRAVPKL